jgi:hypothetical protein
MANSFSCQRLDGRAGQPIKEKIMTTSESQSVKSPSHLAYHVRDGGQKGFWTKVGVAWQHKDGNGFNLQLDCVPIDGRITLRVATEAKD